jgi:hypothetical protein
MMRLTAEDVGYWYLRLNGFLTIPNFVVHPDQPGNQVTDVDVLGVRFPFRAELPSAPMRDEPVFAQDADKPLFVLAEVKTGQCRINALFVDPRRDALKRVLSALGAVPEPAMREAISSLWKRGCYESPECRICFLCMGVSRNPDLRQSYPDALQVTWDEVLTFIYRRFADFRGLKSDHSQWDPAGHLLWNAAAQLRRFEDFRDFILNAWKVSAAGW